MSEDEKNALLRTGHVFNDRGKWKYEVGLLYALEDWDHYDMNETSKEALRRATEAGLSGVTFDRVPKDWTLVVFEPYGRYSFPIMVKGS